MMKFGTLMAILTFCAGATFTCVDIGADILLAYEYWNNSEFVQGDLHAINTSNGMHASNNSGLSIATTIWITLGGLIQFVLVAYFLCRGDERLTWLPKSIRVLLLLCSPILLGPVVVSLYGAVFVIRNDDNIETKNDILRFEN